MLANGNRGLLLDMNLEQDVNKIITLLQDNNLYQEKVYNAIQWSRQYTLDVFENEIKQLLQS
jgi:hypothetical protein